MKVCWRQMRTRVCLCSFRFGATISHCTRRPTGSCAITPRGQCRLPMHCTPIASGIFVWENNGALKPARPKLVMPGNGGIRTEIFYPPSKPVEEPVVINPRGLRTYVRNDVFFHAIPLVLAKRPDAKFICAAMAGEPQALQWIEKLSIGSAVELLPPLPYAKMAEVFRQAQLVVSPSVHDGTPNSLLEGWPAAASRLPGIWNQSANGSNPVKMAC